MSGCNECIAFRLHHSLVEPELCDGCGNKTLVWKQEDYGTFYLECSCCSMLVAVDLNTPCEQDPVFRQNTQVFVEPQVKKPSNQVILDASKFFHVNSLQMRERLLKGFSVEPLYNEIEELTDFLQKHSISFKVIETNDPREKYTYYQHCKYPYSPMRYYLQALED